MQPRRRLLQVLQQHTDESGITQGIISDIRGWIGSEGADWDIQSMIIAFWKEGCLLNKPYYLEGGDDEARFAVGVI